MPIGVRQAAGCERGTDPASNLRFLRRLNDEERSQMDRFIDALGLGVMWRQRTGRLVLPMPAQSDGDRRTGCA